LSFRSFVGVSGVGYAYPDEVPPDLLGPLAVLTAAYMTKADMRIVNVLGHGEGYTDAQVSPFTLQSQVRYCLPRRMIPTPVAQNF
jgi:hypothetical protein